MMLKSSIAAYLAIGSNLGDRAGNIKHAIALLRKTKGISVVKISTVIETKPVGGPEQNNYLNGAIAIKTTLAPLGLLNKLQAIEKKLGRVRTVRWGPRLIDLDILLFGDRNIHTKRLIVPHPRMFEREFVMTPLRELFPGVEDFYGK